MIIAESSSRWRLLAATALLWALPHPLMAQADGPEDQNTAGRALSMHMNTLSTDTHNVRALIGAGEAALMLEDPNGAIGFFGRADEIDPRNGRVKAGLGRALLMLEKPREALRLFDQATDLGVHEMDVARDRGLAYDLRGDQKRAQRDYTLAMRRGADPELTRRMALSLGISGDRDQALKLLDPLLYKQDKAAWRARAFILAMGGDVTGANTIARQVMPGNLARPMGYFFTRLGGLSPAQKAAAVHYGQMPSDGRSDGLIYAQADTEAASSPPSAAGNSLVPAGEPLGPRVVDQPASRRPAMVSKEPRRRPGRGENQQLAAVSAAQTVPAQTVQATGADAPVPARTIEQKPAAPASAPLSESRRVGTRLNTRIGPPAPATQTALADRTNVVVQSGMTALPPPSAAPMTNAVPLSMGPTAPPPAASGFTATAISSPPPPAAAVSVPSTLADIVGRLVLEEAVVVPPPVPAPRKAVAPATKPVAPGNDTEAARVEAGKAEAGKAEPKKADLKKPDPKKPDPKKARPDPQKAEPSRIWAQILTGSDKAALGRDYQKMVKKSPAAFKGKTVWTAAYRSSRRLLVGPFDSQKQAQDFLGKAGVQGFAWTSAAGDVVEKLPLK